MSLSAAIDKLIAQFGTQPTYWVAYSGGLDSHVLLSTLVVPRAGAGSIKLRVIHVNHNISPNAKSWAAHCERICQAYHLDLTVKNIELSLDNGESLEEQAREKRYAAFAELMNEGDILLTAHHQDDQAETLLVQLCRGAGPKGLAAMPTTKALGAGFHVRPLLSCSRDELQAYANEKQLQWIEDESNNNAVFARNYIRHSILPALKQRWSSTANTLARSASNCAEAQLLLDEFAAETIEQVKGTIPNTLSIAKLLLLSAPKQRLILRTWIQQAGFSLPNTKKLEAVRYNVLTAGENRMPCVAWQGVEVRRYRDNLYVMASMPACELPGLMEWDLQAPLMLSGLGQLQAVPVQGDGLCASIQQLQIGFRQPGLKKKFQAWGVPTWLRDRVPLLFINDQLIGAVGYYLDKRYQAKEGTQGLKLLVVPRLVRGTQS